ncbi:MAG: hypothetical protein OXD42_07700 [Rhodospirillaceae bacterium]|nr:hypothetical protein [Rhodospirillaceae bacterium]
MNEKLVREILDYCNDRKIRVTYGAVGGMLKVHPFSVGKYLGKRKPETSWIVNKKTGKPIGYQKKQMYEKLFEYSKVSCDAPELQKELCKKG